MNLAALLTPMPWEHHRWPFPHVTARNVFVPQFYAALEQDIRLRLASGLAETPGDRRFTRFANYDAYGIGIPVGTTTPCGFLVSAAWRDHLNHLFQVETTPYVFAGAHYHLPESQTGNIHNDFIRVWFPRATDRQLRSIHAGCDFRTGHCAVPALEPIAVLRAVVVIVYLLNAGWQEGDGGETGLYTASTARAECPAKRIPPLNNTLVAYECTPHSWHTFLHNPRRARTSLIMWTHRSLEEARQIFGREEFPGWH